MAQVASLSKTSRKHCACAWALQRLSEHSRLSLAPKLQHLQVEHAGAQDLSASVADSQTLRVLKQTHKLSSHQSRASALQCMGKNAFKRLRPSRRSFKSLDMLVSESSPNSLSTETLATLYDPCCGPATTGRRAKTPRTGPHPTCYDVLYIMLYHTRFYYVTPCHTTSTTVHYITVIHTISCYIMLDPVGKRLGMWRSARAFDGTTEENATGKKV